MESADWQTEDVDAWGFDYGVGSTCSANIICDQSQLLSCISGICREVGNLLDPCDAGDNDDCLIGLECNSVFFYDVCTFAGGSLTPDPSFESVPQRPMPYPEQPNPGAPEPQPTPADPQPTPVEPAPGEPTSPSSPTSPTGPQGRPGDGLPQSPARPPFESFDDGDGGCNVGSSSSFGLLLLLGFALLRRRRPTVE